MQKIKQIFIVFFLFPVSLAAQNLLPNPGFDILDSCPVSISQINAATSWFQVTDATPDLFHSCTNTNPNPSFVEVPSNILGFQSPFSGEGYGGFFCYLPGNGYREYIETDLPAPLIVGEAYCVSFYVSLADRSSFAVNGLGAYFSTTSISSNLQYSQGSGYNTTLPFTPQVVFNQSITDTANWVKLSATFIATQPFQYMVLGCFYDDASISITPVIPQIIGPEGECTYYYIDDISVELSDSTGQLQLLTLNTNICQGDSITIIATGINSDEINWSNGLVGDTVTFLADILGTQNLTATTNVNCNQYTGNISYNVIDCPDNQLVLTVSNDSICPGQLVTLTVNGGSNYIWSNGSSNNTISVTPQATTTYTVTGNIGATTQSLSATIVVFPINVQVNYTLIDDKTILFNPFIDATSAPIISYFWFFGDESSSNEENPVHTYPFAGEFNAYLLVVNAFGCTDTIFFTLSISDINTIYIPNSFTPDGDGLNEFFSAQGINLAKTSVEIFNTWGELLYNEQGSPNTSWDGTYKAQKCAQGVYVYKLDALFTNGISKRYIGKIVLLR